MNRWHNRVAVVTGASSGIGASCCKYLLNNGMIVVGLARRQSAMNELRSNLASDELKQRFHAIPCDVRNELDIVRSFETIENSIGPVAVLINNAGIKRNTELVAANNSQDLRDILDTNVMGVALCTREAFRIMQKHKIDDGHVFLINSCAGHKVTHFESGSFNMYPPSKHAVTAMTEIYRHEFLLHKTKLKVTSISPGVVNTEIFTQDDLETMTNTPFLQPEDVADAMLYCLQTPPHVQIHELTIKPVGEQF